jgi:hypothetical protein
LNISGNTTLNNATTCSSSLNVSGNTTLHNNTSINGILTLKNETWHNSADNVYRMFYANNGTTYLCSGGGANADGLIVYSSLATGGYFTNLAIKNNGDTTIRGAINANGNKLNFTNTVDQYKFKKIL